MNGTALTHELLAEPDPERLDQPAAAIGDEQDAGESPKPRRSWFRNGALQIS